MPSFRQEEEHAIVTLSKGMLLIVFWAATWGLIDDGAQRVQETMQLSHAQIYGIMFALVIILFLVFPGLLVKL